MQQQPFSNKAAARGSATTQPWLTSHAVQFCDSDESLVAAVADHLVAGVRVGQPIIMIATPSHRAGVREAMRLRGVNCDDLLEGRDAAWLDAATALAGFLEGGRINTELFDATIGSVLERLCRHRPYVMVRAHGEMVDLLWRAGKDEAALELEELWNGLARRYQFSLLCTYARQTLETVSRPNGIDRICSAHTHVLPASA